MTPSDMTQAIRECRELINRLGNDLDRMPRHKAGSQFHLDRIAERDRLIARLVHLQRRQARAAFNVAMDRHDAANPIGDIAETFALVD